MSDPRSNEELRDAAYVLSNSRQNDRAVDELARRLEAAEMLARDSADTVAAVRHANDTLERRLALYEEALRLLIYAGDAQWSVAREEDAQVVLNARRAALREGDAT
jgi:hypothetical protein